MAKRDSDNQAAISFDPSTFSSGRWDGGRGTVVADPPPHFEYRVVKGSKGDFTVIEAHLSIEDREGEVHDVKWQAGYADQIVIRESNDPASEETESGPSIFAREPGKQIKLRAVEEWSQLLASLQTQGYPSSKLNRGDIGVMIDLDANWEKYARKKDDKYPILVVSEVFDGSGKSKGKSSATAASTKSKATKPAVDEDDEDEKPATKKSKGGGEQDPEEAALEIALEALNKLIEDAGDDEDDIKEAKVLGTTVGDVVRLANKKLKGDPTLRKLVLDLVGSDPAEKGAWIKSQTEFKYKKSTNSIVLVED